MSAPSAGEIQPYSFDAIAGAGAECRVRLGGHRGGERHERLCPLQNAAAVYIAVRQMRCRYYGIVIRFVGNMNAPRCDSSFDQRPCGEEIDAVKHETVRFVSTGAS